MGWTCVMSQLKKKDRRFLYSPERRAEIQALQQKRLPKWCWLALLAVLTALVWYGAAPLWWWVTGAPR